MKFPRIDISCLAGLMLGCATHRHPEPDLSRQPWADSARYREAASQGDSAALARFFAAAEDQMKLPYINGGEDAQAMADNMESVLEVLGDEAFAEALLRETSETRSAVREFLRGSHVRANYPATFGVLAAAPEVHWPSDQAFERSYLDSGESPPPKEPWGR